MQEKELPPSEKPFDPKRLIWAATLGMNLERIEARWEQFKDEYIEKNQPDIELIQQRASAEWDEKKIRLPFGKKGFIANAIKDANNSYEKLREDTKQGRIYNDDKELEFRLDVIFNDDDKGYEDSKRFFKAVNEVFYKSSSKDDYSHDSTDGDLHCYALRNFDGETIKNIKKLREEYGKQLTREDNLALVNYGVEISSRTNSDLSYLHPDTLKRRQRSHLGRRIDQEQFADSRALSAAALGDADEQRVRNTVEELVEKAIQHAELAPAQAQKMRESVQEICNGEDIKEVYDVMQAFAADKLRQYKAALPGDDYWQDRTKKTPDPDGPTPLPPR